MIRRLLTLGGGFLASKAVTVVLLTAITAGGTYVLYVIKDRGALQERVEYERETVRAWSDRFDQLQRDRELFDALDQALAEGRAERERLARTVDRQIEGLRREIPDVEDFLARRAPAELVRVLCDNATLAPAAPECSDDP